MTIVPDGVHPSIQQVKNLVGVVFWGIISHWGASHSCQIYKTLRGAISFYEKSVGCSTVALDAANLNGKWARSDDVKTNNFFGQTKEGPKFIALTLSG